MQLKDKIYDYMQKNEVFDSNLPAIVETIFKGIKSSKISRNKIRASIKTLENEGKVVVDKGIIKNNTKTLFGKFYKHKNGNGSVAVKENGRITEYFVPRSLTLNAKNKSTVNFVIENSGTVKENARVTKVVENENDLVYGVVTEKENALVFIPDDKDLGATIELQQNDYAKKAIGKRCSVHVTYLSNQNNEAFARIEDDKQIFGFINNPMANINAILEESGVSLSFPESVNKEAAKISSKITNGQIAKRKDLRDKNFVTIDPATCKDMDDAVCVEPLIKHGVPVGYKLFVAIADVSNYVKPGTEIDNEAYDRATSIYPAGTVIPMLPEKLSNGICSLNENKDRLAMVTELHINKKGKTVGFNIHEAVINSKQKFSYEEVSALHANEKEEVKKFSQYKPMVDMLYDLEKCISKYHNARGALTIQGFEPTIVLNENKDQVKDYRNDNNVDSHKVIERAMVANNAAAATFLKELGIENIFRVHDSPSDDRFDDLVAKLAGLGLDVAGEPDNKTYQEILGAISEQPASKVMYSLAVRSMKKAGYETDLEMGHFALGLTNYTHFTSPIRRYVDLIEHRLTKEAIKMYDRTIANNKIDTKGKLMSDLLPQVRHYAKGKFASLSTEQDMHNKAFHINKQDKLAEDVSYKADLTCAALYMQRHLNTVQSGYVSKIDKQNITMTIFNEDDLEHSNIIDVLIPLSTLPSKGCKIDQDQSMLMTKGGKILYQLGDSISAKVVTSDPNTRTILATADLNKKHEPEEEESQLV
jgi:ribonuclease R